MLPCDMQAPVVCAHDRHATPLVRALRRGRLQHRGQHRGQAGPRPAAAPFLMNWRRSLCVVLRGPARNPDGRGRPRHRPSCRRIHAHGRGLRRPGSSWPIDGWRLLWLSRLHSATEDPRSVAIGTRCGTRLSARRRHDLSLPARARSDTFPGMSGRAPPATVGRPR